MLGDALKSGSEVRSELIRLVNTSEKTRIVIIGKKMANRGSKIEEKSENGMKNVGHFFAFDVFEDFFAFGEWCWDELSHVAHMDQVHRHRVMWDRFLWILDQLRVPCENEKRLKKK